LFGGADGLVEIGVGLGDFLLDVRGESNCARLLYQPAKLLA
jgi:hypothetical protein